MKFLGVFLLAALACASPMHRREEESSYYPQEFETYFPIEEVHQIQKRNARIEPIARDPLNPYTPGTYAYNFTKYGAQLGSIYGINTNYNTYRADFLKRYGRLPSAADYANRVKDLSGAKFNERFGRLSRFEVKRRFGHLSRSEFFKRYGFYPPVNYNFGTPANPEYWF